MNTNNRDPVRRVTSGSDNLDEGNALTRRRGIRLSFYFNGTGDDHHCIFREGDTREEVATRLRHLAQLVSRGTTP